MRIAGELDEVFAIFKPLRPRCDEICLVPMVDGGLLLSPAWSPIDEMAVRSSIESPLVLQPIGRDLSDKDPAAQSTIMCRDGTVLQDCRE